jgi:hypothetical protein
MTGRWIATGWRLAALVVFVFLAACGPPPGGAVVQGPRDADPTLARQAALMEQTILAGAVLGPNAGLAQTEVIGNDLFGMSVTTSGAVVSGTYVAYLRREFISEGEILGQVQRDLGRNAADVARTTAAMQAVLANTRTLIEGRGFTDDARAAAQANLTEMQRAVRGATNRQAEFIEARALLPTARGSRIDGELNALTRDIAAMRALAGQMATLI